MVFAILIILLSWVYLGMRLNALEKKVQALEKPTNELMSQLEERLEALDAAATFDDRLSEGLQNLLNYNLDVAKKGGAAE